MTAPARRPNPIPRSARWAGPAATATREPAAPNADRGLLGLVLAAGRGSRMGLPKALITAPGGDPLASVHARRLRRCGCAVVLVAAPPEACPRLEQALDDARGWARLVPAETPDAAGTLRAALVHAPPGVERVLITPVDRSPCEQATVAALLRCRLGPNALAAIPVFQNRGGHPALVHWEALAPYRDPVLEEPPPLREVLRELGSARLRVVVADPTVVQDWDYPSDLPPSYAPGDAASRVGAR